jgi:hypothetical protein
MTSKEKARNRKKVGAVALVALGVAGLGAASASQLGVTSSDGVASGTSVATVGLSGATATVTTVRADSSAPVTGTGADAGSVPVDLSVTLDVGVPAGASGFVYVDDLDPVPFTPATTAGTPVIVAVDGLTSHTALGNIGVVVES